MFSNCVFDSAHSLSFNVPKFFDETRSLSCLCALLLNEVVDKLVDLRLWENRLKSRKNLIYLKIGKYKKGEKYTRNRWCPRQELNLHLIAETRT